MGIKVSSDRAVHDGDDSLGRQDQIMMKEETKQTLHKSSPSLSSPTMIKKSRRNHHSHNHPQHYNIEPIIIESNPTSLSIPMSLTENSTAMDSPLSYSMQSHHVKNSPLSYSPPSSLSSSFTSFLKSRSQSSSLSILQLDSQSNSGKEEDNCDLTLDTYFRYLGCRFVEYIGKGSFAYCFKVIPQKDIHKFNCLKLVEISNDPKVEQRLKNEIQILKTCNECKYISKMYADYHIIDMKLEYKNIMKGNNWIVLLLEYGESILKVLKRYEMSRKYFTLGELFAYFVQSIECLYELHEQYHIMHRDVKFSNILLKQLYSTKYDEHMYQFMLCDFNVSKEMKPKEVTSSVVGSSIFIPPEVIFSGEYSNKVDVYGMGVVFTLLLSTGVGNHLANNPSNHTKSTTGISNLADSADSSDMNDDSYILQILDQFYKEEVQSQQHNGSMPTQVGSIPSTSASKKNLFHNGSTPSYGSVYHSNIDVFDNMTSNQPAKKETQIELSSLLERISSKYYLNIPIIGNILLDMIKFHADRPTSKQLFETNLDFKYLYYIVNGKLINDNDINLFNEDYLQYTKHTIKYIIQSIDHINDSTPYDMDIMCNCINILKMESNANDLMEVYSLFIKWIIECNLRVKKHLIFLDAVIDLFKEQDEHLKVFNTFTAIVDSETQNVTNIDSLYYYISNIIPHQVLIDYIQELNTENSHKIIQLLLCKIQQESNTRSTLYGDDDNSYSSPSSPTTKKRAKNVSR